LGGTVLYLWVSKSPRIGGFRGQKSQFMTVPSIVLITKLYIKIEKNVFIADFYEF
jgi:hypothetical protein